MLAATATLADLQLCAGDDILSGFAPALQRQVQTVLLARAKNGIQLDRGNVVVAYTFTVSRGHRDVAEAANYLADLPRLVGRAFGNFTYDAGLGGRVASLIKASATFQAQPAKGLRTWVTFTVTGSLPAEVV